MNIIQYPSANHEPRRAPFEAGPRYIVLHYTDMVSAQAALDRLCDAEAKVSAHYLIGRDGKIYQLVDESQRAWHAGASNWYDITDMNSASIGIELDNPGHENGYVPFTDVQIQSLVELCDDIMARHNIPAENVVGHSDIAPRRKIDPGELFPWQKLAKAGIGIWPDEHAGMAVVVPLALAKLGYDLHDVDAALLAFQRHYAPEELGQGEGPLTRARLAGLLV